MTTNPSEGVTIPWAVVIAVVSVLCSLAVGALMRLAHKGAMSELSSQVERVLGAVDLLRLKVEGEMKLLDQTDKTQRHDMNAMDRRLTSVEREWRQYYGGSVRARRGSGGNEEEGGEP